MIRFHQLQKEFGILLDTKPQECAIQEWLEAHPIAFGGNIVAVKKAPLGGERELDFLLVENITVGFTWTIVELKRPNMPLFKRDDLPTNELNSAIAQAERYQYWIMNNVSFCRQRYPDIYQPRAHVFIGRREGITQVQKEQLRQMNVGRSVMVRTYDSLLDKLRFATDFEAGAQNAFAKEVANLLPHLRDKICYNEIRQGLYRF